MVSRSAPKGPLSDNATHLYVGKEKLFERFIQLSDATSLDKGIHSFPFQLSLPSKFPPSFNNGRLMVEYMVIAIVGFENGCCGLIPGLQKDPLVQKRKLDVAVEGLHHRFAARLEMFNQQEESGVLGMMNDCLCAFPVNSSLMIQMNPMQSMYQDWPISIQKPRNLVLQAIEFEIWQQSEFHY